MRVRQRAAGRPGGACTARFTALLLGLAAASAPGAVSYPFPGVTLVESGSSALAAVDLCAPGVAVRATRYAERGATPEQWATPLGLQLALNADFFDLGVWSFVNGRARGAGEDWPAAAQYKESRSYWQFGPRLAALEGNAAVPPPAPAVASDIVGGHNLLVLGGQSRAPLFDGDGVLQVAARRSAVGMSRDRDRLFLFATHEWVTGTELVGLLLALAAEAGGPGLDVATNVDGGGSTQLYVQGRGQLLSTGRAVANHLGVQATGAGPPRNCPNRPGGGYLDAAGAGGLEGWAWDPDDPSRPVTVMLALAGTPLPVLAQRHRPDLCTVLGSCAHGFRVPAPLSLADGAPHEVSAAAADLDGPTRTALGGSPRVLQFSALPEGLARPLPGGAALEAWGFSAFMDVLPPGVGAVLPGGDPWPDAPTLLQLDAGILALVDTGTLRPLLPGALEAWRLEDAGVRSPAPGELAALQQGPPLGLRPMLTARDGGFAVVDALSPRPPQVQAAAAGGGARVTPAPPGTDHASGVLGCATHGDSPGWMPGLLGMGLAALRRRRGQA